MSYNNEREEDINVFDFPKGKIDQFENFLQCAIRETREEVGIDISPYIVEDQYIRIETIRDKIVNLYILNNIGNLEPKLDRTNVEID